VDSHLLKLQRPPHKVLCIIDTLPRHTPTHDLHMEFKIPYLCGFLTKLCRHWSYKIMKM